MQEYYSNKDIYKARMGEITKEKQDTEYELAQEKYALERECLDEKQKQFSKINRLVDEHANVSGALERCYRTYQVEYPDDDEYELLKEEKIPKEKLGSFLNETWELEDCGIKVGDNVAFSDMYAEDAFTPDFRDLFCKSDSFTYYLEERYVEVDYDYHDDCEIYDYVLFLNIAPSLVVEEIKREIELAEKNAAEIMKSSERLRKIEELEAAIARCESEMQELEESENLVLDLIKNEAGQSNMEAYKEGYDQGFIDANKAFEKTLHKIQGRNSEAMSNNYAEASWPKETVEAFTKQFSKMLTNPKGVDEVYSETLETLKVSGVETATELGKDLAYKQVKQSFDKAYLYYGFHEESTEEYARYLVERKEVKPALDKIRSWYDSALDEIRFGTPQNNETLSDTNVEATEATEVAERLVADWLLKTNSELENVIINSLTEDISIKDEDQSLGKGPKY